MSEANVGSTYEDLRQIIDTSFDFAPEILKYTPYWEFEENEFEGALWDAVLSNKRNNFSMKNLEELSLKHLDSVFQKCVNAVKEKRSSIQEYNYKRLLKMCGTKLARWKEILLPYRDLVPEGVDQDTEETQGTDPSDGARLAVRQIVGELIPSVEAKISKSEEDPLDQRMNSRANQEKGEGVKSMERRDQKSSDDEDDAFSACFGELFNNYLHSLADQKKEKTPNKKEKLLMTLYAYDDLTVEAATANKTMGRNAKERLRELKARPRPALFWGIKVEASGDPIIEKVFKDCVFWERYASAHYLGENLFGTNFHNIGSIFQAGHEIVSRKVNERLKSKLEGELVDPKDEKCQCTVTKHSNGFVVELGKGKITAKGWRKNVGDNKTETTVNNLEFAFSVKLCIVNVYSATPILSFDNTTAFRNHYGIRILDVEKISFLSSSQTDGELTTSILVADKRGSDVDYAVFETSASVSLLLDAYLIPRHSAVPKKQICIGFPAYITSRNLLEFLVFYPTVFYNVMGLIGYSSDKLYSEEEARLCKLFTIDLGIFRKAWRDLRCRFNQRKTISSESLLSGYTEIFNAIETFFEKKVFHIDTGFCVSFGCLDVTQFERCFTSENLNKKILSPLLVENCLKYRLVGFKRVKKLQTAFETWREAVKEFSEEVFIEEGSREGDIRKNFEKNVEDPIKGTMKFVTEFSDLSAMPKRLVKETEKKLLRKPKTEEDGSDWKFLMPRSSTLKNNCLGAYASFNGNSGSSVHDGEKTTSPSAKGVEWYNFVDAIHTGGGGDDNVLFNEIVLYSHSQVHQLYDEFAERIIKWMKTHDRFGENAWIFVKKYNRAKSKSDPGLSLVEVLV